MRDHAGRKIAVECMQGAADVGAPRPAENAAGNFFQRISDIFSSDQVGDAAEGSAENKGLHPPKLVLQAVHELNQESAVAIHGAAHVAKQHDPGFLNASFAIHQVDDLATVFHVLAHRPARIDDIALASEFLAPADLRRDLRGNQQDGSRDGPAFLDAHLAEVLAIEQFLRTVRRNGKLIEVFERKVFRSDGLRNGLF